MPIQAEELRAEMFSMAKEHDKFIESLNPNKVKAILNQSLLHNVLQYSEGDPQPVPHAERAAGACKVRVQYNTVQYSEGDPQPVPHAEPAA
eukprot:5716155-Pyramimonas_sp.AAC.1